MNTPILNDETQLLAWGDSANGPWIKLRLVDSDALEPFRGMTLAKANMAGQRLACVMVEITGESAPELPAPELPAPREPIGSLCLLACQLCKSDSFQMWMSANTEQAAKEGICTMCDIESRKELDTNPIAAELFHSSIRLPYQHYLER